MKVLLADHFEPVRYQTNFGRFEPMGQSWFRKQLNKVGDALGGFAKNAFTLAMPGKILEFIKTGDLTKLDPTAPATKQEIKNSLKIVGVAAGTVLVALTAGGALTAAGFATPAAGAAGTGVKLSLGKLGLKKIITSEGFAKVVNSAGSLVGFVKNLGGGQQQLIPVDQSGQLATNAPPIYLDESFNQGANTAGFELNTQTILLLALAGGSILYLSKQKK